MSGGSRSGGSRRGGPARHPANDGAAPRFDRKQAQLAAQVGRCIEQTLVGECDDEVLQNLEVRDVTPAKGGRMLVTLAAHPPGSEMSREAVLERLEQARPTLTSQLARDLSRRALPELSFWVVRAEGADAERDEIASADAGPLEDWDYDPFA